MLDFNEFGESWITKEQHQHAMAEKDREIAKWRAAHDEMVSRNKLLRDRPDLPADRLRAYDNWIQKYQQLMAQAIKLAEGLACFAQQFPEGDMASEFLDSAEAQAFLKEHHDTQG